MRKFACTGYLHRSAPRPRAAWVLMFLWLSTPLAAQEVELEMGRMNFGPIVTEEVDHFVRFGQDGGMETFYRLGLANQRWYASLRFAPTSLYRWPTDEVDHRFGRYGADPTHSRWRYRVHDHVDDFWWTEVAGGVRREWGPVEGRVGAGLVRLTHTDPDFWDGSPGPKPLAEASLAVGWRSVAIRCRGTAVHVGRPFGSWSALEEAARGGREGSPRRTLLPLSCGFSAGGL